MAEVAVHPPLISRFYGFGSVFGKTLRDYRWAAIAVGLLIGAVTAGTSTQIAAEFGTVEARLALAAQMELLPPVFRGLLGEPINIETLPGFLSWRLFGFLPIIIGIWAITALAGTLAGEAGRGTLEMVLATPVSRIRLAAQKYLAFALALAVALVIGAVLTWLGMLAFATLPGDEASLGSVLAEFAFVFAMSLLFGTIAFALGPLLGRAIAGGIAAAAMFGMFMVNGYAELVPGFDIARQASPFYWTLDHRPMAGPSDWPAVALVAGLLVVIALIGLYVFQRRDLAAVIRVALPGGNRRRGWWVSRWSLTGAGARSLGERLPDGFGWGIGLGLYGLVIAISSEEFAAVVASLPQLQQMIENFFPDIDMTTAGGLLQLAMFNFASLIVGLAAATLVAGWATDETNRRLELVLAAPMRRLGWALRSGLGLLVAIMLMVVVAAVGISIGVAIVGSPLGGPMSGALVLGLYASALAGIGLLIAGLGWPGRAALAVAALAIGMWLLEFLGGVLSLPDQLVNLALVTHLGQPMAGVYNWPGVALATGIAIGGLVGGAYAFGRRDLRG